VHALLCKPQAHHSDYQPHLPMLVLISHPIWCRPAVRQCLQWRSGPGGGSVLQASRCVRNQTTLGSGGCSTRCKLSTAPQLGWLA
jgi:hypothetical protein